MLKNLNIEENSSYNLEDVNLTPNKNFKLILAIGSSSKQKELLFASLVFKNLFYTKSYAQLVWMKEMLKLYALEKNSDITDGKNFVVSQKKNHDGLVQHSLHLKFIKQEQVYIDRATAKTIATILNEVLFGLSKQAILSQKIMHVYKNKMQMYHRSKSIAQEIDKEMDEIKNLNLPKKLEDEIKHSLFSLTKEE